ncbi:hypothetical protein VRU48_14870 [Pedobacter sp. KR3-3]|uniref:TerB family tellurite resistance protein n=1 Tax=Pedobacter albus TaxID=3113905 RepID=A0ABU7IB62_9SPHI|nr:hypothetical protein [Pedobacter sp. KR3-3]MEE1946404.1 hypothetical protein [Pedobacter sp. KR3-3]
MKKTANILCWLVLVFSQYIAHGQTWSEWFRQKATQKKYLLQQIEALKVYAGYLKDGYNVAKDGTRLIGDIKNGDFSLHRDYFAGLKSVKPGIRNQDKVTAILEMERQMLRSRTAVFEKVRQSGQFSPAELEEIRGLYNRLNEEASRDLDEMELVIRDGEAAMTDDERIRRIDLLYVSMQGKKTTQHRLNQKLLGLATSRKAKQQEYQTLKELIH